MSKRTTIITGLSFLVSIILLRDNSHFAYFLESIKFEELSWTFGVTNSSLHKNVTWTNNRTTMLVSEQDTPQNGSQTIDGLRQHQKEEPMALAESIPLNHSNKRTGPPLPTPIFLASLPKSATTSTHYFFRCGGYKSANHYATKNLLLGKCFQDNINNGRPIFEDCGNYTVWTDTGYHGAGKQCFYASVDGLDAIYQSYPNATIMLTTRSTDAWYRSFERHYKRRLIRLFGDCNATGFPSRSATADQWKRMYEWQIDRVRSFAASHPSMTYVEFSIEDPDVSLKLELATGIRSSCWRQANVTPKRKHR